MIYLYNSTNWNILQSPWFDGFSKQAKGTLMIQKMEENLIMLLISNQYDRSHHY